MREILKKNLLKDLWLIFGIITAIVIILQFIPIGLNRYKDSIEHDLSKKFNKTIRVESLELVWHGLHPLIKLKQVSIEDVLPQRKLKLDTLLVGVKLWASLKAMDLKLKSIDIEHLNLKYKVADLTTDLIWRLKAKHWSLETGPLHFLWGNKLLGHSSCALKISANSKSIIDPQKADFILSNNCANHKKSQALFDKVKGKIEWHKDLKLPIKILLKSELRPKVLGLPFNFIREPKLGVALSLEAYWKGLELERLLLTSKQKSDLNTVSYLSKNNLLSGNFNFLHFKIKKPELWLKKTTDLPNLRFTIKDFAVNNLNFGSLTCNSSSSLRRVNIQECKFESEFYNGLMHGNWLQEDKSSQTTIDARFETHNLINFLKYFGGWSTDVESKYTILSLRANWPAPLDAWSLKNLNVNLYLEMQRGRITHLDNTTEGKLVVGKLWSIISLQTIARRLKLDFSDLVQTGYVFDIFKANFAIRKGILYVQDGVFEGPVAKINLSGNIDLIKQLYNIKFTVTPHVVADVPVLATMAAGPIAWIGSWYKAKVARLKNKNATPPVLANNTIYHVYGSWYDPTIAKVH